MFHLPVAYGRGDSYHGPRHSYLLDLVLLHVLCSPRGEISSEPCPARPCGGGSTLTAYSGDLGVAMNLGRPGWATHHPTLDHPLLLGVGMSGIEIGLRHAIKFD